MELQSVPAVVMAGIAAQLGLYHLALFARSSERQRDLTFGLICLVVAAYDAFSAGLYEVRVVGGGGSWQRAQLVCAALGFALLVRFVDQLTGQPPRRPARMLSRLYFVLAMFGAFERAGLVITDAPQTKVIDGPFGLRAVYHEVAWGPFGMAFSLCTPLFVGFAAIRVRDLYRRGDHGHAYALGAALAVLVAAVINDSLVGIGWLSSFYVFEYAFLALVVLVAFELSNETVRAAQTAGALAESEARLGTILDAITDAVVAVDAHGRVARVNPAAEALTGWPRQEAVGRPVGEVVSLVPREGTSSSADTSASGTLARLVASDAAVHAGLLRARGGAERLVTRAEAPLCSREGVPVGAVFVLHDVTQERVLEARLREAERMESIGRIAGGVAHDFNNLLTPIVGYARAGLRKLPEGHPTREGLQVVLDAANRAAELTRQLLAFGGRQLLDVRSLDLNATIETMLPLLRKVIREDIHIETDLAPELGAVRADRSQIEQILMNLAVNARDAMPEGGTLTFETHEVGLAPRAPSRGPAGPYVGLVVRDTGLGMDALTRRHLFEPFYTTKDRGRGTGLGLATVHGIVQQHGGRVEVSSKVGEGTTFRVYLPRVEATLEPEVSPPEAEALVCGSETVLVVDDDAPVRRFAADVLTEHGYRVLVAEDGTDALRVSDAHPGPIDLLLTDVIMPGMDGPRVCDALRERRPAVACIVMSGYAERILEDRASTVESGLFLQKPFTEGQLLARVREALSADAPAPRRVVPS